MRLAPPNAVVATANGLYVDRHRSAEVAQLHPARANHQHLAAALRRVGGAVPADRRAMAAVFAGGALGATIRTGLVQLAPASPGRWPWVTFAVNLAGCFLLGYFVTRLQERLPVTAYRRPFLGTGLCGALTTFSTFQIELLEMLDRGELTLALAYGGASLAGGFAGMALGTALVRRARLTW